MNGPAHGLRMTVLLAAAFFACGGHGADSNAVVWYDRAIPELRFAVSELRATCDAKGMPLGERDIAQFRKEAHGLDVVLAVGAESASRVGAALAVAPPRHDAPQSYAVRVKGGGDGRTIAVMGADAAGAMYGGLDVAEALRVGALDALADDDHVPFVARRGIKFNIPLDARTPSYSDNSDGAQQNIPEMWSMDFWCEFLDCMARHRFNVLTLWSLHPFPSIVKVPEYPDVALADVMRSASPMDDTFSHTGSDMVRPAMLANLRVVRRMSIEEKTAFWRDVMQHARDRGIEVYLFTWNIFTFGATGKHGITPAQDNRTTIDYFRASVRETVLAYPLLAGMGVTAGEQMADRKDEFSKERWLWKAYGEGIRDALARQPGRSFRLIHRFHMTGQAEILREWKDYPGPFDLSFKYAIAHMYSVPAPPFLAQALPRIPPGLRTWLTVRNDDVYSFRWCDPGFARAFVRALPAPDRLAGFYMGPDGYCWGREFLGIDPAVPRELVMQKQWASFMLWGRLSFDPELPDGVFERAVAARFPEASAPKLCAAWARASNTFPGITRFFWGDIDLKWYPEACLSHPRHKGFYTVRHFIEGRTMPESGFLDILAWRAKVRGGNAMNGLTPLDAADALANDANAALSLLPELRAAAGKECGRELRATLDDIEAMAHLGDYYASKIRGAAALALFDAGGAPADRAAAIAHLENARGHWKSYACVYARNYKPQLLNRVGFVDIPALAAKVDNDVGIALEWKPGTIPLDARPREGADVPFKP